jgi:hypothetical protein
MGFASTPSEQAEPHDLQRVVEPITNESLRANRMMIHTKRISTPFLTSAKASLFSSAERSAVPGRL